MIPDKSHPHQRVFSFQERDDIIFSMKKCNKAVVFFSVMFFGFSSAFAAVDFTGIQALAGRVSPDLAAKADENPKNITLKKTTTILHFFMENIISSRA